MADSKPNTKDSGPDIFSREDLLHRCEVEDLETGEVKRLTFTYVDHCDGAWFGCITGVRKYDITIEEYQHHLKKIPDELVYPMARPFITALLDARPLEACYIKRPKLLHLDDLDLAKLIPKTFADEVEIMELLKDYRHPNLIQYYGCTIKNGRVTGIALERHGTTLLYRYEDDERSFDISRCKENIRAGVEQLHRLGFAHNDLNPSNILLDKDDRAIVIDFGSCRRFGEPLVDSGTPGWVVDCVETPRISAQQNDDDAIETIEAWLEEQEEERTCQRA